MNNYKGGKSIISGAEEAILRVEFEFLSNWRRGDMLFVQKVRSSVRNAKKIKKDEDRLFQEYLKRAIEAKVVNPTKNSLTLKLVQAIQNAEITLSK